MDKRSMSFCFCNNTLDIAHTLTSLMPRESSILNESARVDELYDSLIDTGRQDVNRWNP